MLKSILFIFGSVVISSTGVAQSTALEYEAQEKAEAVKTIDERDDLLKKNNKLQATKEKLENQIRQLTMEQEQLARDTKEQENKLRTNQAAVENKQVAADAAHEHLAQQKAEAKTRIEGLEE